MDENLQPYDYYYANESSQYKFYQLPKELFDNPRYENLSDGAKILYGLMLDRMSLSRKNGWIDNEEKVYIIFTLESIMSAMKCKHDKAVKMLAELDSGKKDKNGKILIKGVRLIERKKQGQGNPSLIYLRKFFTAKGADNAEVKTSESPQSRLLENRSQEFGKTEVKTSEKPKSRLPKIRSLDFGKSECSNTNHNNTDFSDNLSINPSTQETQESPPPEDEGLIDSIDMIDWENIKITEKNYKTLRKLCEEYFSDRIGNVFNYPARHPDRRQVEEIKQLVIDTILTTMPIVRVNKENIPTDVVRERFFSLTSSSIEQVVSNVNASPKKVENMKAYLLTALFNAPLTQESFYSVQFDIYDP